MQVISVNFSTFKLKKLYWRQFSRRRIRASLRSKYDLKSLFHSCPCKGHSKWKKETKYSFQKPHVPSLHYSISVMRPIFSLTSSSWFSLLPIFHHLLDLCLPPPLAVPAEHLLPVGSSHPKLPNMLSHQQPEDTDKTVLLSNTLSTLIFKRHFFPFCYSYSI